MSKEVEVQKNNGPEATLHFPFDRSCLIFVVFSLFSFLLRLSFFVTSQRDGERGRDGRTARRGTADDGAAEAAPRPGDRYMASSAGGNVFVFVAVSVVDLDLRFLSQPALPLVLTRPHFFLQTLNNNEQRTTLQELPLRPSRSPRPPRRRSGRRPAAARARSRSSTRARASATRFPFSKGG